MAADASKKGDVPLVHATIAWTPGTDRIEVKRSRLGDWRLLNHFEKIAGNTGLAWREMSVWERRKKFRDLIEKITEVDQVDHAAIDDSLSVIPEYRDYVSAMNKEARQKTPDPAVVAEMYRMLRAEYGDTPEGLAVEQHEVERQEDGSSRESSLAA